MKKIQKHKKSFLWLSIMVTILIVLIIAFVLIFDIRTINVPDDAVWKGNSKEALLFGKAIAKKLFGYKRCRAMTAQ